MEEKARKWSKSKVNLDQVNQNTKNAQQFVELTEKYKTLGSQIEAKIDTLFNFLGTHFMSFDPNLTIQQELEMTGQKEKIKESLMMSALPKGLDFKSIMATDLKQYATTLLKEKYQTIVFVASKAGFFENDANYRWGAAWSSVRGIEAQLKEEAIYSRLEKAEALINKNDDQHQYYMKQHIQEQLKAANISEVELVKTYLQSIKDFMVGLDPCDMDQIRSALNTLEAPEDKKILEEWFAKVEARELFLKTTSELHDAYDAFLELDTRSGTKTTASVKEKIAEFLSGVKAFATGANSPKAEEANSQGIFKKIFTGFANMFGNKEEAKQPAPQLDKEEDVELSDSTEVAVLDDESQAIQANIVKTIGVESYESIEQVHKEYQTLMSALIDAKKVTCFSNVMQATKMASSCLIRKPFEQANASDSEKLDCATYDAKAKKGMAECDFIFPFGTDSDDIISDYLNKSSKVDLNIYDNGQTGLKSHGDEVVADLTIALGQAVVAHYKALSAGSTEQMMAGEYQKPIDTTQEEQGKLGISGHDGSFAHQDKNALVPQIGCDTPEEI